MTGPASGRSAGGAGRRPTSGCPRPRSPVSPWPPARAAGRVASRSRGPCSACSGCSPRWCSAPASTGCAATTRSTAGGGTPPSRARTCRISGAARRWPTRSAPTTTCSPPGTLYPQLPITIDGSPGFGTAVDPVKGDISPVVVRGAVPVGRDELALGRDTLDQLDADDRRRVVVSLGDGDVTDAHQRRRGAPGPRGRGLQRHRRLPEPGQPRAPRRRGRCARRATRACGPSRSTWPRTSTRTRGRHATQDPEAGINVALPSPPAEIDRLTAVEDLPRYLAGFLALLAAAADQLRHRDHGAPATTGPRRPPRARDEPAARPAGRRRARAGAHRRRGAARRGRSGSSSADRCGAPWPTACRCRSRRASRCSPRCSCPSARVLLAQVVASTSRRAAGRIPAAPS